MKSMNFEKWVQQPPKKAEWVGLRYVREKTHSFNVKDDAFDSYDVSESEGVMVEALVAGQMGYAATSELTEAGISKALESAVQQADRASQFSAFQATPAVRPSTKKRYQSLELQKLQSIKTSDVFDRLLAISKMMKVDSKIVRRFSRLLYVEVETQLLSSSGSDAFQRLSLMSPDFEVIASHSGVTQKRSDAGLMGRSQQGGIEVLFDRSIDARAEKIAHQAVELCSAEMCPTLGGDLVLMPDQMMLQIHESIGHPLEVDRILGDERNYAGWSFVKLADFGQLQYGSSLMNVVFDPTLKSEFASYGFDDHGAEAQKEYLIKDGKLLRGLGGLESQVRSSVQGVANSRASLWNRPPIDRMANLNLEAGTTSFTDMISKIDHGVLMETNRSWSIDDFRNKFQFGCEYAKLIEKGKVTKTLRNPNYRGDTLSFWRSLKAVGDPSTFKVYGTPFCGKGEPNQVIRVGHASPVCHFSGIEIFGGVS
jgi:predicted Zn-dependent protease